MRNLARGHALSQVRTTITIEDIPMVMYTAFSTPIHERVRLFELLIEHGGELTTNIVCKSLMTSPPTALRTMTELMVSGLVNFTTSSEEEEIHNIEMGLY